MKNKVFWFALMIITNVVHAQTTMSLSEAQLYAANNSYLVKTSELEIEKANKQLWEITAIGLPQIKANVDYSYSPQIPQQPIPAEFFGGQPGEFVAVAFGVEHNSQASVALNQLIFDGAYLLARKGSELLKKIRYNEYEKTKVDVKEAVSQAYFNASLAFEAEKIIENNLELLNNNLKEVTALFDAGFVEEQDAEQLEYLVNSLQSDLENVRRSKTLSLELLKFTIGMPLEVDLELSENLTVLNDQIVVSELIQSESYDFSNNVNFKLISNQEIGATLALKRESWSFAPVVSGFISHSQSSFSNDGFNLFNYNQYWIPATVMGFNVSVPLFTSGQRLMRVAQAKIELKEVQLAKFQISESLKLEFNKAKSDYLYALEKLKNEERNKNISNSILKKTLVKYSEGLSSSLDVTQVQNQYLATENSYLNSLLNVLIAKSKLERLAGRN